MFSVMEARRKALKISQTELALTAGVSQAEISLMENGYQAIPERLIEVLSRTLSVTPQELSMSYEDYLLAKQQPPQVSE